MNFEYRFYVCFLLILLQYTPRLSCQRALELRGIISTLDNEVIWFYGNQLSPAGTINLSEQSTVPFYRNYVPGDSDQMVSKRIDITLANDSNVYYVVGLGYFQIGNVELSNEQRIGDSLLVQFSLRIGADLTHSKIILRGRKGSKRNPLHIGRDSVLNFFDEPRTLFLQSFYSKGRWYFAFLETERNPSNENKASIQLKKVLVR